MFWGWNIIGFIKCEGGELKYPKWYHSSIIYLGYFSKATWKKQHHNLCQGFFKTRHSATASSQLELSNLCKKILNRSFLNRNIVGGHLLGSPTSSSSSLTPSSSFTSFLVGSGGECIYMQTGIGRGKVRSTGVLEKWNWKKTYSAYLAKKIRMGVSITCFNLKVERYQDKLSTHVKLKRRAKGMTLCNPFF